VQADHREPILRGWPSGLPFEEREIWIAHGYGPQDHFIGTDLRACFVDADLRDRFIEVDQGPT
jgi:hypothetical protein